MKKEKLKKKAKLVVAPVPTKTGCNFNADRDWQTTLMCGWGPMFTDEQLEEINRINKERAKADPYYPVAGD